MSVIADNILLTNSVAYAPRVVAAEVFDLARRGYVTLEPVAGGVRVVRTDKTPRRLSVEQRVLLGVMGSDVLLQAKQQVPVAQTIVALSCHLLRKNGLARKLSPQKLVRRLTRGWFLFLIIAGIVPVAIYPSAEIICVSIALVIYAGFGFRSSLKPYKQRAVLYNKLGSRQRKRLRRLHQLVVQQQKKRRRRYLLPYELLWTTGPTLMHAPVQSPSWFRGDWPETAQDTSLLLRQMFNILAEALEQPLDKKGRFALNETAMKDAEVYMLVEDIKQFGKMSFEMVGEVSTDSSDYHS